MPSKRARRRLGFPSSITTRGLDTFMAFKLTTVYRDHHQNFGGIDLLGLEEEIKGRCSIHASWDLSSSRGKERHGWASIDIQAFRRNSCSNETIKSTGRPQNGRNHAHASNLPGDLLARQHYGFLFCPWLR
ncbi:uncharacterized protein LOC120270079 isoform X2 [Dioscorea cayenensis subsp. rotundata]|uniref:Uncharacterized protein LOC120270079 isoform X2 n=1 Tax=Dioscorea cayennensis subsp. rotundata TaxID=55577 RepID=A0AB40C2A4_DIOCR|nr:uncharacterized protein LOC120270079 isoform X2 [Dioscorea cayenensis subsp. rotundata]